MEKSENSTQLLFLRERHGNPLQYSCLENPMYRGAWQAAVHGISKTERLTLGFAVSLRRGRAALVPQTVKTLPAMKEMRFSPWVRKIPGEGHGHPLQYSCLENPLDGGAWQASVHGIAKSLT